MNDSLSKYYKFLWKKCKSFQSNQFIHTFLVTNGTARLKAVKNGRVHGNTHFRDLKECDVNFKKSFFFNEFLLLFTFKEILN